MKIPKIIQLPSGNYFCQLRINGVSIPITAETEKECELLATLKKAELLAGRSKVKHTPKETTLQEAMDKYIQKRKATLSPSTIRSYTIYSKTRFAGYRDKKLSQIKWQQMIDEELAVASEKTVKNAWALVRPSLELVGYPVPKITLARPVVPDLTFLQPEEIKPFCDALKGRSYEIPALLALHGLRLSEIRGLDWKNVDLKKGMLFVQGARVRGPDGDIDKKTNKNKSSSRYVPIMIPRLATVLQATPDKTGKVAAIGANTLLDDVKRTCERAGVTVCTVHDLRRSFASLCFFLNIPSRQIQEWGGWQNDQILNKIYIKISTTMKTESQTKFTNFFTGKKQNANGMLTEASNVL